MSQLVLVGGEQEAHVAAALAVLAGIAAADAICGFALGQWSRGQDHAQAAELLAQVKLRQEAGAVNKFRRLLADKDAAHYSPRLITRARAEKMVEYANALVRESELW